MRSWMQSFMGDVSTAVLTFQLEITPNICTMFSTGLEMGAGSWTSPFPKLSRCPWRPARCLLTGQTQGVTQGVHHRPWPTPVWGQHSVTEEGRACGHTNTNTRLLKGLQSSLRTHHGPANLQLAPSFSHRSLRPCMVTTFPNHRHI